MDIIFFRDYKMRRTISRCLSLLFCRLNRSRALIVITVISTILLLTSVHDAFLFNRTTKVKIKHRDLLSIQKDIQTYLAAKAKKLYLRDNFHNGDITERNQLKLKSCDNCNETIKSNLHLTQKDASRRDAHIRGHESLQRQDTDGRINTCYNCSKGLAIPKTELSIPDHMFSEKTHFVFNNSTFPKNASTKEMYVCDNCFHFDFAPIITQSLLCNDDTFLLILIHSRPSSLDVRNIIRYTWASKCDGIIIRCFFMLGNSGNRSTNEALFKESEAYNDIIQFDFVDSYNNLTYKTMASFKWASENCPTANYVLKTDDDSFINIKLLHTLLKAAPSKGFYGGGVRKKPIPNRRTNVRSKSKWYVTFDDFPFSFYPRYSYGRGYVLSMDLVSKLVAVAKNVPFFFIEDIYTGLCVEKLGIKLVNIIGFTSSKTRTMPMTSCYFNTKVFALHHLSPKTITYFWKKYNSCSKFRLPKPTKLYKAVTEMVNTLADPEELERLRRKVKQLSKTRLGDSRYQKIMGQVLE